MTFQSLGIEKALALGYVVTLGALFVLGYTAYHATSAEIESADWVARTEQVISSLEGVRSSALDAESMGRKYLATGDPVDLARYQDLVPVPYQKIGEFRKLTSDNLEQIARADQIQGYVGRRFTQLTLNAYLRRDEGVEALLGSTGIRRGQEEMDSVKSLISAAITEENRLLAQRKLTRDKSVHSVWRTLALTGVLGVGILTWLFNRILIELRLRHAAESQANHLAYHDGMTGLPNRRMLQDRLSQALVAAQRHKHKLAVLFLDLDGFKQINDKYGHDVGDELLKDVGKRLLASIRKNDTAARLGGDEFVIVLTHIEQASDAEEVARKLVESVCKPYEVGANTLTTTTSVGISLFPDHGTKTEELMKNADLALYTAKTMGKNRYCWFSPSEGNSTRNPPSRAHD